MQKYTESTFLIKEMDCPSEEQMIRMKLEPISGIEHLTFDIPNRTLTILHSSHLAEIDSALNSLNLGSTLSSSQIASNPQFIKETSQNDSKQKKTLFIVFAINFLFFVLEMTFGLISKSMGLVADSLDMLADAFVYAIALFVVGKATSKKKSVALLSGIVQLTLAVLGFLEVLRRFIVTETPPDFVTMITISFLALIGNAATLLLLKSEKSNEPHIQATMIFTSNDVLVNIGVIATGVLVLLFNSPYPDLLIGAAIFVLVLRGAIRILRLSK